MIFIVIEIESIPQNKYYATKDNIIIMFGDNPREIAQKIIEADIEPPVIIKYNGNEEAKDPIKKYWLNQSISKKTLEDIYLSSN